MLLPSVGTWQEWARIFTDVGLWKPAVREVCRTSALPCRRIEAGYPGTNAVFIVDRTYVVKVYAPFCHRDFGVECTLYHLLVEESCVPAPRLVAQGVLHDQIDWPYIVMDFRPGKPIRDARDRLSRAEFFEIAFELGQIVRAIHRIPLEHLQGVRLSSGEWMQFIRRRMAQCEEENRREGVLSESILGELPGFLSSVELDSPLLLLNGDLTEDHVLIEQRNDRWVVSGLIDFADALIGAREYEWIALWFGALGHEEGSLEAFMAGYDAQIQLDGAFLDRVMAFTFLHLFGAGIIRVTLEQLGSPQIGSLQDLQEVFWGNVARRARG
jgi:hygromycin-B 7''-O-kinase